MPASLGVTNLCSHLHGFPVRHGSPASGTTHNFTSPQTYTVTAQNGSTKVYTRDAC